MAKRIGTRDLRKEKHWKEIMLKYEQSEKNVREFCSENEINEHLFYSWRKELRNRAMESQATASFVPVKVKDTEKVGPGEAFIELITPSGYACKIPAGFVQDICQLIFKALVQK